MTVIRLHFANLSGNVESERLQFWFVCVMYTGKDVMVRAQRARILKQKNLNFRSWFLIEP